MPGDRSTLQELHFDNPRLAKVGVEVLSLGKLHARGGPGLFSAPRRVDFHHLLFVERGSFPHMVDFDEYTLVPGTVLLVRPGQVQQWRRNRGVAGQVLLISGEALAPALGGMKPDTRLLALGDWPASSRPDPEVFRNGLAGLRQLSADIAAFEGSDIEVSMIRHALWVVLLRLARVLRTAGRAPGSTREAEIHALFTSELEAGFAQRRNVRELARRLGFSESTISRACVATVGRTAKQVVDRRVVLEAQRLLVHSREPIIQIAHRLGFTEATNFVKFFKRLAGLTPLEFRNQHEHPASR